MAGQGFLKIVSEGQLQENEAASASVAELPDVVVDEIAHMVRTKYEVFKRHREESGLEDQMLEAQRAYNGKYSASKLAEIRKFGGSEVFSRITSIKCRGATALLRDVFLGADKPWEICPTPDPTTPDDIAANIEQLVAMEMESMTQRGMPVDPAQLEKRRTQLYSAAKRATLKTAKEAAKRVDTKINDILTEGGFYKAFIEFITDLPIMPMAYIKGPVVRIKEDVSWVNGEAAVTRRPTLCWQRVSAMDIYRTPGVSDIADSEIVERCRFSRSDLNTLIGLPGYDEEVIRKVLTEYPNGYAEAQVSIESERSDLENREESSRNESGMYDAFEFHGVCQGKKLLDKGFKSKYIGDPDLDYAVTAWVIGKYTIKVQLNPNPKKRHPYYGTSYERVPGSVEGNGVPEIIKDSQNVANATLRSLVNNMSISSGPQVGVNEERLSPSCNPDTMYPWKRWRFINDPMGSSEKPLMFFQPESNAAELLAVYKEMTNIADEVSGIPRYMSGSDKIGGAGRTASGLSMLMNNASKVLQNVAASIDQDVMEPLLQSLYDMVMLTDTTGMFRGDERIVVRGVQVAMQKEQDRMRRLEFLQITGNPMDAQIVGPTGRASILRALAQDLGLPEESIVPTDEEIKAVQQGIEAQQKAAAQAQGDQPPAPGSGGGSGMAEETDNAFRTGGNV